MSFSNYSIKLALSEVLAKLNITEATPIQAISFQPIQQKKDVYLKAETGSGKTLAYLLPLLSDLVTDTTDLQVIILAPTHELASQIHDFVKLFSDCFQPNLKSQLILGDTSLKRQIEKLKKKPQIIVGSAGRILDLIESKKLKVHKTKTLVLDEADRMLAKTSFSVCQKISKACKQNRQLVFVSATDNQEVKKTVQKLSPSTEWLVPEQQELNKKVTHAYLKTAKKEKLESLRMLIKACKPSRAILFAHHQDTIEFLNQSLKSQYSCVVLVGNLDKLERQKAINDFKNGKVKFLITTDVSARGLDIPDVSHVFQYDLPNTIENYLHRAGRTGRMSKEGGCLSLVTHKELPLIEKLEKELGTNIEPL